MSDVERLIERLDDHEISLSRDFRREAAAMLRLRADALAASQAELSALQSRVGKLERGARRYLFLRDDLMLREAGIHCDDVDAAVDAAIAQERET